MHAPPPRRLLLVQTIKRNRPRPVGCTPHQPLTKVSLAHGWLQWNICETCNCPTCVADTAREELRLAPLHFNERVSLRVSHAQALKEGDPKHQDWLDSEDYWSKDSRACCSSTVAHGTSRITCTLGKNSKGRS